MNRAQDRPIACVVVLARPDQVKTALRLSTSICEDHWHRISDLDAKRSWLSQRKDTQIASGTVEVQGNKGVRVCRDKTGFG